MIETINQAIQLHTKALKGLAFLAEHYEPLFTQPINTHDFTPAQWTLCLSAAVSIAGIEAEMHVRPSLTMPIYALLEAAEFYLPADTEAGTLIRRARPRVGQFRTDILPHLDTPAYAPAINDYHIAKCIFMAFPATSVTYLQQTLATREPNNPTVDSAHWAVGSLMDTSELWKAKADWFLPYMQWAKDLMPTAELPPNFGNQEGGTGWVS